MTRSGSTSKKRDLAYWIPTLLVALTWTFGGLGSVTRAESSMEVFQRLGYPSYFSWLLGPAQLLGVAALLAPVPPRVREWAYAGLAFDALAALASLVASGQPLHHLAFPIVALAALVASYRAWLRRTEPACGARGSLDAGLRA